MKTRLRELRMEKNLTQTQLSLYTHISQSSLCKMETECANVNGSQLITLARYFGVSTDYFLYLTNERLPVEVKLSIQKEASAFHQLFYYYSKLTHSDKKFVLDIISKLAERVLENDMT